MFLKHIHFDPAVDGGAGGGAAGGSANGDNGGAQHWSSSLPPEFTLEHDGKPVAAKDTPFVKDFADLPSLVKQSYDLKRAVSGGLTKIPGKDAKPEEVAAWKKENLGKLAAAGLMELAPESADKYEIKRPDEATGLAWNDEHEKGFRALAHGLGLSQKQVAGLIEFDNKRMADSSAALKMSVEKTTEVLKGKWGADYDKNYEIAARGAAAVFTDQDTLDFFEKTGLGNHPLLMHALFEIGARMQEHNGHVDPSGGKGDPKADLNAFLGDKEKVTKWNAGDPAMTAEYENIMKRIHGTKEV